MKKANPPVKTGDVIEMEITGLSHDGAGVGKYQGFTIFVPQTVPDEKVRVRVQVVKKTYGKGEAIQVLKSHPRRTEPLARFTMNAGDARSNICNILPNWSINGNRWRIILSGSAACRCRFSPCWAWKTHGGTAIKPRFLWDGRTGK